MTAAEKEGEREVEGKREPESRQEGDREAEQIKTDEIYKTWSSRVIHKTNINTLIKLANQQYWGYVDISCNKQ